MELYSKRTARIVCPVGVEGCVHEDVEIYDAIDSTETLWCDKHKAAVRAGSTFCDVAEVQYQKTKQFANSWPDHCPATVVRIVK